MVGKNNKICPLYCKQTAYLKEQFRKRLKIFTNVVIKYYINYIINFYIHHKINN